MSTTNSDSFPGLAQRMVASSCMLASSATTGIGDYAIFAPFPSIVQPVEKNQVIAPYDEKATNIFLGLLAELGFKLLVTRNSVNWIIKKDKDSLSVGLGGDIYLNKEFRCVTTNGNSLPFADILFSKVVALATNMRSKISTLDEKDLAVIERLLPLGESKEKIKKFLKESKNEMVLESVNKFIGEGSDSSQADNEGG